MRDQRKLITWLILPDFFAESDTPGEDIERQESNKTALRTDNP